MRAWKPTDTKNVPERSFTSELKIKSTSDYEKMPGLPRKLIYFFSLFLQNYATFSQNEHFFKIGE